MERVLTSYIRSSNVIIFIVDFAVVVKEKIVGSNASDHPLVFFFLNLNLKTNHEQPYSCNAMW